MSTRNPTIKRILKEASELASQPSSDYHAAPLENDLFEWHFTLRGPPAPSPFDGGIYHGRIVLPPAYPLKPPSFRFLTPTGRFEVNREICLSISGHHEETWQPAWGIRTALVAIRSFMDTEAQGQLGGMDTSNEVRKRFAAQSKSGKCATCGKNNEEIMKEQEERVQANGGSSKQSEDVVPEELRLAYREDLSKSNGKKEESAAPKPAETTSQPATPAVSAPPTSPTTSQTRPASGPAPVPAATAAVVQQQQRPPRRQQDGVSPWIDKAIYGIVAALAFLVFKKFMI